MTYIKTNKISVNWEVLSPGAWPVNVGTDWDSAFANNDFLKYSQYTSYCGSEGLGTLSPPLPTSLHVPQIPSPHHSNTVVSQFLLSQIWSWVHIIIWIWLVPFKSCILWLYLNLLSQSPIDLYFDFLQSSAAVTSIRYMQLGAYVGVLLLEVKLLW